ncbi:MAG: FAD:protein FMN transferase [bacterium]
MTGRINLSGKDVCRFEHQAMATLFEVMIACEDPVYAQSAAVEAFQEIDRLELELSRYNPNSDISRLNNLSPHSSIRIGYDAFQCLLESIRYAELTGGAFDVTVGRLMDCWIARDKSARNPSIQEIEEALASCGRTLLELDEASMMVRTGAVVPCIDLGAIGKGYAVDCVIELLKEWEIGSALVHGGMSSVFAFGEYQHQNGWPVTLSDPRTPDTILRTVTLDERALGGSGVKKGFHIIDPRSGQPVRHRHAAWVVADSATQSDALSTACMMMTKTEIEQLVLQQPHNWAMIVDEPSNHHSYSVFQYGSSLSV